jgi:hypothetical protein
MIEEDCRHGDPRTSQRQGGAKTHHTHDLSNHERISQRLENLVLVQATNSTREIIGTTM